MSQIKVTQVRSAIGGQRNQRATLRSLGLRRIGDSAITVDRPEIQGMINTVAHLVQVESADQNNDAPAGRTVKKASSSTTAKTSKAKPATTQKSGITKSAKAESTKEESAKDGQ